MLNTKQKAAQIKKKTSRPNKSRTVVWKEIPAHHKKKKIKVKVFRISAFRPQFNQNIFFYNFRYKFTNDILVK